MLVTNASFKLMEVIQAMDTVYKLSHKACSVVIVGVGKEDFTMI